MQAPILAAHGLKKHFGGIKALDGIDLSVKSGEIAAVIGPNGSGKTTLFNVISGVSTADAGTLELGGRSLVGRPAWEVFGLGISRTFQGIRLTAGQSVIDNVLVGLYLQARTPWADVLFRRARVRRKDEQAKVAAMKALEHVAPHLIGKAERSVDELSYADRRRVEIARAIASNPRLLLLDEPAAGMNNRETDRLGDDIQRINESGVAILLIEHKVGFVSRLARHITVMNFGRKIAEGTHEEVLQSPAVIASYLGRRAEARK